VPRVGATFRWRADYSVAKQAAAGAPSGPRRRITSREVGPDDDDRSGESRMRPSRKRRRGGLEDDQVMRRDEDGILVAEERGVGGGGARMGCVEVRHCAKRPPMR